MPTGAIKTPNANGTRQPQLFKLDWDSANASSKPIEPPKRLLRFWLAPGAVAISADEGAAKRPRDETDAESGGRRQIAHQDVVGRKERLANHSQECGVDREIEEFETVAEDRREDSSRFEHWPGKSGCGVRPCGQASLLGSRRGSVSGPRIPCQRNMRLRPITSQEQRGSGGQKP